MEPQLVTANTQKEGSLPGLTIRKNGWPEWNFTRTSPIQDCAQRPLTGWTDDLICGCTGKLVVYFIYIT